MPSSDPLPPTVHATAVALGEAGLLLRGPSGAGKSALAMELVAQSDRSGRFARLVADDRVALRRTAGGLVAFAPPPLAGLVEVRGVGVVAVPFLPAVRLSLVVDMVGEEGVPRIPDAHGTVHLAGVRLPVLRVPRGDGGAALRAIHMALRGNGLTVGALRTQRPPE